jgi:hypothetical protein
MRQSEKLAELLPPESIAFHVGRGLSRRFRNLERLVSDIKDGLPPYGPKRFADMVLTLTTERRESLDRDLEEARLFQDDTLVWNTVRSFHATATVIHQFFLPSLTWEERLGAPVEMLHSLVTLAQRFAPSLEIAIESSADFNYQFQGLPNPASFLFKSHEPADDLNWIVRLSVPRVEERDALHHPILVHEIGHMYDLSGNVGTSLGIKPDSGLLASLIDEEERRATTTEAVMRVLRDWVRELVADSFAIAVCGPAYFLAFADMWCSGRDHAKHSNSHPAPDFRAHRMLTHLENSRLGYPIAKPGADVLCQRLKEWRAALALAYTSETPALHTLAEVSIRPEQLTTLDEQVDRELSDHLYTKARFDASVPKLAERIGSGLLPVEDSYQGKPALMPDVLNAGWDVYLCHPEDFERTLCAGSSSERSDAMNNLGELLLKAMQLAEVYGWWRNEAKR